MRFYDNLLGHDLKDPSLKLNNRGHRCKDIEDVNLHNYILFAGDNVALDYNLPIEKTYPYLISQQLNTDYYNLSIFNGGLDSVKYNLLTWFSKYPKPKCVVINTEFLNSILVCLDIGEEIKVADYNDPSIQQIMVAGEKVGLFFAKRKLAENVLRHAINVPIYQISFKDKMSLFTDGVTNVDHTGNIFDHESITNEFLRSYRNIRAKVLP